jgi:predicted nucleic acid-binding protein
MYVVDASVMVSEFLSTDSYHESSRLWFRRLVDDGEDIIAPSILLAELAGAVARRSGLSEMGIQSVFLLRSLPNFQAVDVDSTLADLGANVAAQMHIRGADALYVALALQQGTALVTWDRQQRERASNSVPTLTPLEAMTI